MRGLIIPLARRSLLLSGTLRRDEAEGLPMVLINT